MPTSIPVGKRIEEVELLDMFPPYDGMITQYYGRIGSGKTYAATSDILDLLRRGQVIYANWKINYNGYDQRTSLPYLFISILFPWKKRLLKFPKDNLRYFEFSDKWAKTQGYSDFIEWLASRTDCHIFGDEGHVMFDSYQGMRASIEKRATILHTRHFDRSIHIISQRPTAIHVAMRANVNVFYKCEKKLQIGPIIRFRRIEYQDMLNENVDEDEEKIISKKGYWGKKAVFEAYDTKYLRGDTKQSQHVHIEGYEYGFFKRIYLFFKALKGYKPHELEPQNEEVIPPVIPSYGKTIRMVKLGHVNGKNVQSPHVGEKKERQRLVTKKEIASLAVPNEILRGDQREKKAREQQLDVREQASKKVRVKWNVRDELIKSL